MSENKHSVPTSDREDDDLELVTLGDVIDNIVGQADKCLTPADGPIYPTIRARFAEEYPDATAEELDEHFASFIAWAERIDRKDVGDRAEDGRIVAPDVWLENFGCRHPMFRSALRELENIHANTVGSESGGREAIICALRITRELIERLPLFDEDRDKLFEPLRLLQTGLTELDRGNIIPALKPGRRGKGRPPESIRAEEFRIRCIMAVVAWSQPGLDDSEPKAIRRVYKSAKDAAEWIGITGIAKCGGFSTTTIQNWLTRHNAVWTRFTCNKCAFEEMPREIREREALELIIVMRHMFTPEMSQQYRELVQLHNEMIAQSNQSRGTQDEPPCPDLVARMTELTTLLEPAVRRDRLREHANTLLRSLQKSHFDRPLPVLMNK